MANEKINKDQEVEANLRLLTQLTTTKLLDLTPNELDQVIAFHKKEESGPLFKGTKILDILLQLKKDREGGKEINKDTYKKDLESELEIIIQNIKGAIDFGGLE
jgi:hypothetical protein